MKRACILGLTAIIAIAPTAALSALEPPDVEATEVLIHAQGTDLVFLTESLPWLPGDTIRYQMSCDYGAGSFAYHTDSGQTVGGVPFDLSVSGTRDSLSGDWAWFGVANWGLQSIEVSGDMDAETSDFSPQDENHLATGKWVKVDPGPPRVETTYTLSQWVKWKEDPGDPGAYLSHSDSFHVWKGLQHVGTAKGDDRYKRGEGWTFTNVTFTADPAKAKVVGAIADSGTGQIDGSFVQTLEAVPEPSILLAVGLWITGVARRRRNR
jgi:hypothetical protein